MFKRPDTFARISLFPERPATSKSFVALSTCVPPDGLIDEIGVPIE